MSQMSCLIAESARMTYVQTQSNSTPHRRSQAKYHWLTALVASLEIKQRDDPSLNFDAERRLLLNHALEIFSQKL